MTKRSVTEETKNWVEKLVIGVNLCPFAKLPFQQGRIRFAEVQSADEADLIRTLLQEMSDLVEQSAAELETTLIIFPNQLNDFADYLEFVAYADELLHEAELTGILQIASFHPQYQFANTGKDDIENYTNRSPYPMLHLIREESIERALENYTDPEQIPLRNVAKMKELGHEGVRRILED